LATIRSEIASTYRSGAASSGVSSPAMTSISASARSIQPSEMVAYGLTATWPSGSR
jgi:hypothetical protein